MGLAASQARFLCITARKADCEYKSTELAQQKLDITKQLGAISTEYSNAMNATKLMWSNDAVNGSYGMTYSLLMMPSAANDFNPYMVTTSSGAIVLNGPYAAAAKAAGISKSGGIGSQESRDKFISALVPYGLVTEETAKAITVNDYAYKIENNSLKLDESSTTLGTRGIDWNPSAGMGRDPLNKGNVDAMTLAELCMSEAIGLQTIDWAKMFVGSDQLTTKEFAEEKARLGKMLLGVNQGVSGVTTDVINQLKRDLNNYKNAYTGDINDQAYKNECARLELLITQAEHISNVDSNGKLTDGNGNLIKDKNGNTFTQNQAISNIQTQIDSDLTKHNSKSGSAVSIDAKFNTSANLISTGKNGGKPFSIVQDGVINHYKDEIENMTIGDILSGNVVIMANTTDSKAFAEQMLKLLDSFAAVFGYSKTQDLTGTGLNVDDESAKALKFAYTMVKNTYLRTTDMSNIGSRDNDHAMTENSAYINAVSSNRIGTYDKGNYFGVSLTNMLSSFLTYYDNALNGADSNFVVGKTTDTSNYVTDYSGYYYMAQVDTNAVKEVHKKSADFYDELYNNIIEHGWREDSAIDDNEYLESAIKDGRYSMSSLNNDGYYYQTRYNETGYIVEVSDTDAIARAEAEFTSKKAELTYKEDSIDMKTKKLDAEISSLSTEYDTVKSLISKSIEKTFAMFSN